MCKGVVRVTVGHGGGAHGAGSASGSGGGGGIVLRMRETPRVLIAALVATAAGCASGLRSIDGPVPDDVAPSIDRVIDLGALPLSSPAIDVRHSDRRFAAGEHVAILGAGLHAATKLFIDERELPLAGFVEGGVLTRVPPSVPPGARRLTVQTPRGEASTTIEAVSFAVGADSDGNALRFVRAGERVEKLGATVEQPRTLYHAAAKDGGLIYALGVNDRKRGDVFVAEIATVHLAAAHEPRAIGRGEVELTSRPSAVAMSAAGHLIIVGHRHLAIVDVSAAEAPRVVGRLALPAPHADSTYIDVVTLGGRAVVLDTYGDAVVVIELADPKRPAVAFSQALLREPVDLPLSVDLVLDGDSIWVIQGPNLRLAGSKVKSWFDEAVDTVGGWFGAETAATETPEPSTPGGRLLPLSIGADAVRIGEPLALPVGLVPLLGVAGDDGVYVSGVNSDVLDFSEVEASLDGLKAILDVLVGSVQVGRVVHVGKDGASRDAIAAVSLIFDLSRLPDGRLVYSGLRLGGRITAPFISVAWGIGVQGRGFFSLRKLGWRAVMPPYAYGQVQAI